MLDKNIIMNKIVNNNMQIGKQPNRYIIITTEEDMCK